MVSQYFRLLPIQETRCPLRSNRRKETETGRKTKTNRAASTLQAFSALNYTVIYLHTAPQIHQAYLHLSSFISLIIWEGEEFKYCLNDGSSTDGDKTKYLKECIKREGYEKGIPAWKSVIFHFWGGSQHPFGPNWTLSPEKQDEENPNRYLGML